MTEDHPSTFGDAVINAIGFVGALDTPVFVENHSVIFVWNANAAEQIEAKLAERWQWTEKASPNNPKPR